METKSLRSQVTFEMVTAKNITSLDEKMKQKLLQTFLNMIKYKLALYSITNWRRMLWIQDETVDQKL